MKKKFILLLFAVLGAVGMSAQSSNSQMKVTLNDGKVVYLSLAEQPTVTHSYNEETTSFDLVIKGNEVTSTFDVDEVKIVEFVDEATDVESVKAEQDIHFSYFDGRNVNLTGIGGQQIIVSNIDGKNVLEIPGKQNDTVTINMESYPAGIYIIRVGNKRSFKILRR